jgi:hypothetical protein
LRGAHDGDDANARVETARDHLSNSNFGLSGSCYFPLKRLKPYPAVALARKHPSHVLSVHAQPLGQLSGGQPLLKQFNARSTVAAASLSGIPTIKPSRVRGSVVIALLCENGIVLSDLGFVVQNGVQQRLVNSYFGVVIDEAQVVIDEAQLAEFVHEEADAGSRRPNHFRKRLLTESDWNDTRVSFLSIVREKQQQAGKPLLTRIEKLIDYVFLDPTIPAQQMFHKQVGEFGLDADSGNHCGFCN